MTKCLTSYGYAFHSDSEPKEALLPLILHVAGHLFIKAKKKSNDTITKYMAIVLLYANSELSVTEIKKTVGSN